MPPAAHSTACHTTPADRCVLSTTVQTPNAVSVMPSGDIALSAFSQGPAGELRKLWGPSAPAKILRFPHGQFQNTGLNLSAVAQLTAAVSALENQSSHLTQRLLCGIYGSLPALRPPKNSLRNLETGACDFGSTVGFP
jgi:hypothetical protein